MNLHTLGVGHLPYQDLGAGLRTPFGTIIPTGANVHYYRTTGQQDFDPPEIAARGIHTTLNSALGQCRSGRYDTVIALPGSAENISAADQMSNLVAGTQIVSLVPQAASLTWSAAGSTFLLDVDNVALAGFALNMAGSLTSSTALTVAAPMTITGAGCKLLNNRCNFAVDADQLATIGITTTAAADDLELTGNQFWGDTAGEVTTFFDIIGCDRLKMWNNHFAGATSAVGVGIVRFATTASLNIDLRHNAYINRKAASTAAVTGLAGVSGVSFNELFHYLDNLSTTPWITSPGLMTFYNPRVSNLAGEVGMIATVVST